MDAERTERLRLWLLGILAVGLLGTVTELLLLEHYEKPLQFVPLILIAAAIGTMAWHVKRHDATSLRALKIVMALFVLAGFVGVLAHFRGSAEFQLELDPSIDMWTLLGKILHAQAPPLLAPGMMLQMGLIGLAYVFSDARYRRREMK